jgi:hypothetical protein
MPAANNPTSPVFYVYYLEADGVPFYVGFGRAGRAPYRVAYIRNRMDQKKAVGKGWALHCEVAAQLMRSGHIVDYRLAAKGLLRARAEAREKVEIAKLLKRGNVLANVQHNPNRPESASAIAKAINGRLRSR